MDEIHRIKGKPHLTPESEVLNFGFEVSYVCDLRTVLTEGKERVRSLIIQRDSRVKTVKTALYVGPSFNLHTSIDL